MKKTAILLMTYIRPENTKRILNLLIKYKQKNIFIFNDGLKLQKHKNLNRLTKNVILNFKKKNKIKNFFSKKNLTQKNNLPIALNWVFKKNDKVIILEDDCIPSRTFFRFCRTFFNLIFIICIIFWHIIF